MVTIDEYLEEIMEDFQNYLNENPDLCNLKSVNFNAGIIPDYSDIHVQQLYLLRYAFAYAFEYKRMYLALLNRQEYKNDIFCVIIGMWNYGGLLVSYTSFKAKQSKKM